MPTIATPIKPELIRWAFQRTGKNVPEFAKTIGAKEEQVNAWLDGTEAIPLAKAHALAAAALVPLPLLYLPAVPETTPHLADFRTVNNAQLRDPSPELEATIRLAETRQKWYREYLVFNGHEPLRLVGSLVRKVPVPDAARHIVSTIGLQEGFTMNARTAADATRMFLDRLEDAGVLVMRNGVLDNNTHRPLDPDEFRGFALADEYAPLIFVNTADARSAQLFTIAHETVHIFQGGRGVSGTEPQNANERFCNRVAAEILAPAKTVAEIWRKAKGDLQKRVEDLANTFHLSLQAMLLCVRDTGLLTPDQFRTLWTHATDAAALHGKGGNFYRTLKNRVSPMFTRAVIVDAQNGRTPYLDAFRLLTVKNREGMERLLEEVGV